MIADRKTAYDRLPDPTTIDWSRLKPLKATATATATIVIPVYGALEETLHCIHGVLNAKTEVNARLLVIDDRSPDETLFDQLLLASDGGRLFELLRNDENRGFVYTANRGILAADGDVILLNSDTIVSDFWVDKLQAAARSAPSVASVSPMTNNATILSYPVTNRENHLVEDLDVQGIADLFARNAGVLRPVEALVTVGFCMLLAAEAIQAVGGLDEALFGIGYGEECDWCMRASYAGFKHLIAVDTYVYHFGSVSFSEKATRRQELARRALDIRHPEYWPGVGHFCASDPLFPARRNVDIARFETHLLNFKGVVVHVLHALGGGTDVYARHVAASLAPYGYESIFFRPDTYGRLALTSFHATQMPNLVFNCADDLHLVERLMAKAKVARIHVHNRIGFSPEATRFVSALTGQRTLTLHDYVSICPQITLLDQRNSFCDVPSETRCNVCLRQKPAPLPSNSIAKWRGEWHEDLVRADRVIAPSAFVKTIIGRVFPDLTIHCVPHHDDRLHRAPMIEDQVPIIEDDDTADATKWKPAREIAVFGNINHHKGRDILNSCSLDAYVRQLPLRFVVFGSVDIEPGLYPDKLRKMGSYTDDDIQDLLRMTQCRIGFLPSIWPETYSYVLSEFIGLGLHPVAFNLGAQDERLRALRMGTLIEIGSSASAINDVLLSLDVDEADRLATTTRSPLGSARDYFAAIYGDDFAARLGPDPAPDARRPIAAIRGEGVTTARLKTA